MFSKPHIAPQKAETIKRKIPNNAILVYSLVSYTDSRVIIYQDEPSTPNFFLNHKQFCNYFEVL